MAMKKTKLIPLIPLSIAGGALAQVAPTGPGPATSNSVNLFGVVDVAIAYGHGNEANTTRLVSGANTSSRIGFRGYEDLGDGLAAGFWLEAGVNPDDGSGVATNTNNQPSGGAISGINGGQGLTFGRRSTVSLISKSFGELRLGRDFVSTYRNRDQTDPFDTNGVGANVADSLKISGVTGTRASNMIAYYLPQNLGGFFGEAQYYFGENASNAANHQDGSGYQGRLGWASGPFGIAVAAGRTRYATTATLGDIKSWNVGANYDFKFALLTAGFFEDKENQLAPIKARGYIVGGEVPLGASLLKAAFSRYGTDEIGSPSASKIALGVVYNLSKRTATYATYAHLENHGPMSASLNNSVTSPGGHSDGVDIGIKHSF
jgi:predicted porin